MAAAGGGLPRLEKTTLGSSHSNHGKFRRSQKKLKNAANSNAGLALLGYTLLYSHGIFLQEIQVLGSELSVLPSNTTAA